MTSDGLGIDRAVPSESGTGVRGQSPVELSTSLDRTEYGCGARRKIGLKITV